MSAQDGVISRRQALECGLTSKQIRGRLESGRWVAIVQGVYRHPAAPITWHQRVWAAVVDGPPGTVASCTTAAAVHGLVRGQGEPHVIVPGGSSGRSRMAVVHRVDLSARDRMMVGGIPRTTVSRTMIDCAAVLPFNRLCDLVDAAFCEGSSHRNVVLGAIDRAQVSGGRPGVASLRRALEAWSPGIVPGSPAEMRLLRQIAELGVEPPQRQLRIHDAEGRGIGRVDAGWPTRRIGLEYDSDRHHGPRAWRRDEGRQVAYAAAGWIVHRVDKHDLRAGNPRLVRLLEEVRLELIA
jgi:hypothetical protein